MTWELGPIPYRLEIGGQLRQPILEALSKQ
jgi:hypothetical protein